MRKILIVDDCYEVRETISLCLQGAGFDVVTAEDAEAAVSLAKEQNFDLILCDLIVPQAQSFEQGSLSAGIWAIQKFSRRQPQVPVIAMSGMLEQTHLKQLQAFGAKTAVAKPFNVETLISEVNERIAQ